MSRCLVIMAVLGAAVPICLMGDVTHLVVTGRVASAGSQNPVTEGVVELRWPGHDDTFKPLTAPLREDGSYMVDAMVPLETVPADELTITVMAPGYDLIEQPLPAGWQEAEQAGVTVDFELPASTLNGILDIFSCCVLTWSVLTVMLPAFLLGAAITAFVPSQYLLNLLGPQAPKHKAYGAAVSSGMVLSLCSCNVVPLFVSIWQSGAGTGPAFAFLYAGPAINVVAMVFTAQVIGLPIGIFRVVSVAVMSLVVGLLMARVFGARKRQDISGLAVASMGPDMTTVALLLGGLFYLLIIGAFEMPVLVRWGLTAPGLAVIAWLMVSSRLTRDHLVLWARQTGNLLMKVIPILLPAILIIGWLAQITPLSATRWLSGNNSLPANAAAAWFGSLMYFPILTEVPFAKTLLKVMGVGIGPAMALLLTAPGLSLPGMIIVGREIGWRRLLVYVICVVTLATFTGMLFGSEWGAYICSCRL